MSTAGLDTLGYTEATRDDISIGARPNFQPLSRDTATRYISTKQKLLRFDSLGEEWNPLLTMVSLVFPV